MATEKQITANRLNAQKCTGPKSEEGKARSSQNAFKTGIDSRAEVMQCESRDEYNQLIAEFHRDYAPIDAAERTWVDIMIRSEWLNRRYMSSAAAIWDRGFDNPDDREMGKVFIRHQAAMLKVTQCQNSAVRNFDKAYLRLKELQAKRPVRPQETEIAPEPPDVSAIATEPLNPEPTPELVSLQEKTEEPSLTPEPPAAEAPKPQTSNPEKDLDPPIAA